MKTMLSERQIQCLQGIGIRRWRARQTQPSHSQQPETPVIKTGIAINPEPEIRVAETAPSHTPVADKLDTWEAINQAIHACESCQLAQGCTQKVPGVGNPKADLMIIGEGPGHDEDIKGEPFVGRSGKLLDKMLHAIGVNRQTAFITNIVKCRPPNNRDPNQSETQACAKFLNAQIEQISPKVILSVGRISAQNLLGVNQPVGRLIKQSHRLPNTDIPLEVTYHPAYLLRNPSAKAVAWQDMKTLHRILNDYS